MKISELVDKIGVTKKTANDLYKQYKEYKDTEESLKEELKIQLAEAGLRSTKTKNFNASLTQKPDIQVTHEQSVMDWLKQSPNVEEDAYIGLKLTPFKGLALHILKETGEIVPGTETLTKESISIRENK